MWVRSLVVLVYILIGSIPAYSQTIFELIDLHNASFQWNWTCEECDLLTYPVEHIVQCGPAPGVYTSSASVDEPVHLLEVRKVIRDSGIHYCSSYARYKNFPDEKSANSNEVNFQIRVQTVETRRDVESRRSVSPSELRPVTDRRAVSPTFIMIER